MNTPYKAFLSYARDPDDSLARDIEEFLENIYRNKLITPPHRKALEICRDGSDFRLPPVPESGDEETLFGLVRGHLELAEYFILLVGPKSRDHQWLNRELDWWLANRGPDKVLICVSHGADPRNDKSSVFPKSVLENRLDQRLWFDFRRFQSNSGQDLVSPSDYEDERIRLAAELLDTNAGSLADFYRAGQSRVRLVNRIRNTAVGALGLALAAGSYYAWNEFRRFELVSQSNDFADQAVSALQTDRPVLAAMLGAEAIETTRRGGEDVTEKAESTLRRVLQNTGGVGIDGHTGSVEAVSFLSNALLSVDENGQVLIHPFSENLEADQPLALPAVKAPLELVIESGDGRSVALVFGNGQALLVSSMGDRLTHALVRLEDFQPNYYCAIYAGTNAISTLSTDGTYRRWAIEMTDPVIHPYSLTLSNQEVSNCEASPNGSVFVYQAGDRPRILMDDRSGSPATTHLLPGTAGMAKVAAFDPSGTRMAVAIDDDRVEIWNIPQMPAERPHLATTFTPDTEGEVIVALALSNSHNRVAIATKNGTVSFWNGGQKPRQSLSIRLALRLEASPEKNYGASLTFLGNGRNLLVADSARGYVLLEPSTDFSSVNVRNIQLHGRPDGPESYLGQSLARTQGAEMMAIAGNNNNVRLFAWSDDSYQERIDPLKGHDRPVSAMAFSFDRRLFASGDHDGLVRLWHVNPAVPNAQPTILPEKLDDRLLNGNWISSYSRMNVDWLRAGMNWWLYSEGGVHVSRYTKVDRFGAPIAVIEADAIGSAQWLTQVESQVLMVHSGDLGFLRRLTEQFRRRTGSAKVADIVFAKTDPVGQVLVSQDSGGRLAVWNLRHPGDLPAVSRDLGFMAVDVATDAASGTIAAISASCRAAVWDSAVPEKQPVFLDIGKLIRRTAPLANRGELDENIVCDPEDTDGGPPPVTVALNGRALLIDKQYLIWNLTESVPKIHRFDTQVNYLKGCCFLALADDVSRAWELGPDGDEITEINLPARIEQSSPAAFDEVRGRLAIGLNDGRVWIRKGTGGNGFAWFFRAHDRRVVSLAFDTESGALASAGSFNAEEIRLTHLSDRSIRRTLVLGSHVDRLTGSKAVVPELKFSPDGSLLAAGGWDQAVTIYSTRPEDLVELARRITGRQLTDAERAHSE